MGKVDEWRQLFQEERRAAKVAGARLADAAKRDDPEPLLWLPEELSAHGAWREAMLAARRVDEAGPAFQSAFIDVWKAGGNSIRSEVGDDLLLGDALRRLLPPYTGAPIVLYRGESSTNRRTRTYGLAWSSRQDVAEALAVARAGDYPAGSVLVSAVAAPAAIICSLEDHPDSAEAEYLVDRRRLGRVVLIRRFT